ncbi:MAG: POTRA domain-containing protein [Spirochaetota bacterium]|nr:POTRA domain-containing protein [Spirochaetota bacterium]
MIKNTKIFLYSILFILHYNFIIAAEKIDNNNQLKQFIEEHGDLSIGEINFSGLKKTKPSVIQPHLKIKKGMLLSEFDANHFIQDMHATKLFKEIKIDYSAMDEKVFINIYFKEKITLIPIPFISTSATTTSYGIYLMEQNFFGYNKKLFIGASFSSLGWISRIGYIDPKIIGTDFVCNLYSHYGIQTFENADSEGDIYQIYNTDNLMLSCAFGYRLIKIVVPYIVNRYKRAIVDMDYSASENPPSSAQSIEHGIMLRIRDLYYADVFEYGIDSRIEYVHGFPNGDHRKEYDSIRFRAKYSFHGFNDQRVYFTLNFGYGNVPTVFEERIGGKYGFKTLPSQQVATDHYLSFSATNEVPVALKSWGVLSVTIFCETGMYRHNNISGELFYGPGVGMRLYLKDVAVPAFGVDVAYNVRYNNAEISAFVGASM